MRVDPIAIRDATTPAHATGRGITATAYLKKNVKPPRPSPKMSVSRTKTYSRLRVCEEPVNHFHAQAKRKIKLTSCGLLTCRTKLEQCSLYVLEEDVMLKCAVEEVAALTSLALFVSMIAIWAQVIAV